MADEATIMALHVRERLFSITRSLVLVYETNNFAFIRYLNKYGVIKSHFIVFNQRTIMVHKVIVQVGRQTNLSLNRKLLLRVMIEQFREKCCFPIPNLVSSIRIQVKKL